MLHLLLSPYALFRHVNAKLQLHQRLLSQFQWHQYEEGPGEMKVWKYDLQRGKLGKRAWVLTLCFPEQDSFSLLKKSGNACVIMMSSIAGGPTTVNSGCPYAMSKGSPTSCIWPFYPEKRPCGRRFKPRRSTMAEQLLRKGEREGSINKPLVMWTRLCECTQ